MTVLARLVCLRRGHDERTLTLPEDGWGLYAVSRTYCKRCGLTTYERYPFSELAQYNSERGRGIRHTPEYAERMAIQQEYFDQRYEFEETA